MVEVLLGSVLFTGVAALLVIGIGNRRIERRFGVPPSRPARPAINPPDLRLVYRKIV